MSYAADPRPSSGLKNGWREMSRALFGKNVRFFELDSLRAIAAFGVVC